MANPMEAANEKAAISVKEPVVSQKDDGIAVQQQLRQIQTGTSHVTDTASKYLPSGEQVIEGAGMGAAALGEAIGKTAGKNGAAAAIQDGIDPKSGTGSASKSETKLDGIGKSGGVAHDGATKHAEPGDPNDLNKNGALLKDLQKQLKECPDGGGEGGGGKGGMSKDIDSNQTEGHNSERHRDLKKLQSHEKGELKEWFKDSNDSIGHRDGMRSLNSTMTPGTLEHMKNKGF